MSFKVEVTKAHYGVDKNGSAIDIYTLHNDVLTLRSITYGARVTCIEAADRNGYADNVVLGYPDLPTYEADKSYFGALVGRYANRLAKGQFTLNGTTYQVPTNNGDNALHGGTDSFAQRVWSAQPIDNGVEMTLVSPSGDMGFPGQLTVRCRYTLVGSAFRCDIFATTDADTVVNLTNHSYFNLSGEGNGTIMGNHVTLAAERFVPVNDAQIPTGELRAVAETPFDFRTPRIVGQRIDTAGDVQLELGGGYDHSFVLNGPAGELKLAGTAVDPQSGRTLTVETTQPGVHFYTGNSLTGNTQGSNGKVIERRGGLCMETQHFPDSPNQPAFPSTALRPDEQFHETTVFTFGIEA